MEDQDILIVTLRRPEDLIRFLNKHHERHHIGRYRVVRIAGPEGRLGDSESLRREALRLIERGVEDNGETLTISARNLPPIGPCALNRHGFNWTPQLELRLHLQKPGRPGILEDIALQDRADWAHAQVLCLEQNQPALQDPREGDTAPREGDPGPPGMDPAL